MAPDVIDARTAIDATNRRFEAAFNAGDPARAAREVYTADARVLPPDAPMVRGRDAIAAFWVAAAEHLRAERLALSTLELELAGDTAHEIGQAAITVAGGATAHAKFVVVWKLEAGDWRWHIDIWNMGV